MIGVFIEALELAGMLAGFFWLNKKVNKTVGKNVDRMNQRIEKLQDDMNMMILSDKCNHGPYSAFSNRIDLRAYLQWFSSKCSQDPCSECPEDPEESRQEQ